MFNWQAKTPLKVSENNRFLISADGTPFFYLGDTGWTLLQRLTLEEIEYYFETRSQQGFNSIQVMVISEMDGLRQPTVYGQVPLLNMNPETPNNAYFEFLDKVLKIAFDKGLFLALVPTWGDKVDKCFGIGPEIFTPQNAYVYGQWLGKRYKNVPNIIWFNGGDRSGGGRNFPIWDALAKGIKSEDQVHLMTFHPLGDASSSMWFHDSEWLDFNICQSGHSMRNYPNFMMIAYDYNRKPAKPCFDSEPRYEEHAINWKLEQNGVFDDYDIRQAAYWAVFAGACGHTYGAHCIWQMYDYNRPVIGWARYTWKQALSLKGAQQLKHLTNLLFSRPYFDRIPDQSPVPSPKVGEEHTRTTRGQNYIFSYLPTGGEIEIYATAISGDLVKAWWYDPRNGKAIEIGIFDKSEKLVLSAPSQGRSYDWVLVLDDADAGFEAPGKL
jgi:hypothetical protein